MHGSDIIGLAYRYRTARPAISTCTSACRSIAPLCLTDQRLDTGQGLKGMYVKGASMHRISRVILYMRYKYTCVIEEIVTMAYSCSYSH